MRACHFLLPETRLDTSFEDDFEECTRSCQPGIDENVKNVKNIKVDPKATHFLLPSQSMQTPPPPPTPTPHKPEEGPEIPIPINRNSPAPFFEDFLRCPWTLLIYVHVHISSIIIILKVHLNEISLFKRVWPKQHW